jgi:hypothetical protein
MYKAGVGTGGWKTRQVLCMVTRADGKLQR